MTSNKCGFCREVGHNMNRCNSDRAKMVVDAIVYSCNECLNRGNLILFARSKIFYDFLQTCNVKELQMFLIKKGISHRGTKLQLTSRIVYQYFYLSSVFPSVLNTQIITFEDRVNMDEYMKYWLSISYGGTIEQSDAELDDYFQFVRSLEVLDYDEYEMEMEKQAIKFPIHVNVLDTDTDISAFDCAICMEEECLANDKIHLGCNHSFCKTCVIGVMKDSQAKNKHPKCALCRDIYSIINVNSLKIVEEFDNYISI